MYSEFFLLNTSLKATRETAKQVNIKKVKQKEQKNSSNKNGRCMEIKIRRNDYTLSFCLN